MTQNFPFFTFYTIRGLITGHKIAGLKSWIQSVIILFVKRNQFGKEMCTKSSEVDALIELGTVQHCVLNY